MQLILEFQPVAGAYRMCTFPVVRKLYRDTIGPDRPVRSVAVRKIYRTGVWLVITMLQYYICLGIVLTVILVLGLGLGFGIILYFVIGT